MNAAGIAVLSAAGAFALTGIGYGVYQAGVSQGHGPVATAPDQQQTLDARIQAAVQAAMQPAVTAPVAPAPVESAAMVVTTTTVSAPAVVAAPRPAVTTVYTPPPPQVARVLHVEPVTSSWQEPREVCQLVTVQRQVQVHDDTRAARTVLGAAAGGLLGNQVGGGSGKKVATVVGALAGAQVGNQTAKPTTRTVATTEQQCNTVMETRTRTNGYLVSYEYNGQLATVRTSQRPGDYLPVENGRVIVF
ncbi:MAG: glycine zipper 2TM domain-containing protein [Alcanivoracaceae bacterium]